MAICHLAVACAAVFLVSSAAAQTPQARTLEVRSYNLKPGTRDAFHEVVVRDALPLLRRASIDVVAHGPSQHDADSYFLMRAFPGIAERQRVEDAFYTSKEWLSGPREAILSRIVNYTTVVVTVDDTTLGGLRRIMNTSTSPASELNTLLALNDDYIRSVQASDVARFERILADDFLATLPDGRLLNRAEFLAYSAKPVSISDIAAHDVNVRILGDIAIVHARTTYTMADGKPGEGRYTDVWARRGGKWLAVAAHVTRK